LVTTALSPDLVSVPCACKTHLSVSDLVRVLFGQHSTCHVDIIIADYNSAFIAGVTAAATWDRATIYQRGNDMGSEHREKGVDVQLGPVVGPLGRSPEG